MLTLQGESNEDSYWWLDGEAPKNTSRNVGHGRRFKRSCQTHRGVSQKAPVRNANLWASVLDHNTASKNWSLVREVQDGRTQTRQYYENPSKNSKCRRKANFQSERRRKRDSQGTRSFRSPAMPTNAHSMTRTRLTKAKGVLCPTSLVAILQHLRLQEVQKHRRARIPCQFLLHQPLLCFRAVYRRYRQELVFHRLLIKRPFFRLGCQYHVQPTTQQLNISTTAL